MPNRDMHNIHFWASPYAVGPLSCLSVWL